MTKNALSLTRKKIDAVVMDMDGVITRSATVHARAWKEMFDTYLKEKEKASGNPYEPFDIQEDYKTYVDGKPRYEGVGSFLQSRSIELPKGSPDDEPEKETVCGLGNRKNQLFQKHLQQEGVETFPETIALIRQLRDTGYKTAVVSSSKNCRPILEKTGIADLFDTMVDGVRAEKENLPGKPAPDIFLRAAKDLRVEPGRAVVVEDAEAGVEAGHKGGFGLVVGVNRGAPDGCLKEHGANEEVSDLGEIRILDTAARKEN